MRCLGWVSLGFFRWMDGWMDGCAFEEMRLEAKYGNGAVSERVGISFICTYIDSLFAVCHRDNRIVLAKTPVSRFKLTDSGFTSKPLFRCKDESFLWSFTQATISLLVILWHSI